MATAKLKLGVFNSLCDQTTFAQLESRLEPDMGIQDGQLIGIDFVSKPMFFELWDKHGVEEEITLIKATDNGLTFSVYYDANEANGSIGSKHSLFVPWSNIACLLTQEEVAV